MATAGIHLPEAPTTTGAVTGLVAAWRAEPGWQRALLVIGVGGATVATWWWLGATSVAVAGALSLALVGLGAAAMVDLAERRLPNRLLLVAAAPVLVVTVAAVAVNGRSAAIGAVLGVGLCAGPLFAAHLVSPAGIGFGDVKAAAVLGGALGLGSPVVATAALLSSLLLAAVAALVGRQRDVPLGPWLIAGTAVAIVAARMTETRPW